MRYYCDQGKYQNRYRSNSAERRMSYGGRAQYRQNYRGRSQYDHNYRSNFRRGSFRRMQIYRGQNFRGGYRGNYRNDEFGWGRHRSRERQNQINLGEIIKAVVDQDQVWEQVLTDIGSDVLGVGCIIILLKTV